MDPESVLVTLGKAKLIEKLLGPTCEYIGQNIQQLTEIMLNNLRRLFLNASEKLGNRLNEEGSIPPKVLKNILENGAWCDEELQCEYFGGILASSRSNLSRDDRGAYLASIISRLSAYHLRMHYLIYSEMRLLFSGNDYNICESDVRKSLEIYIPIDTYITAMDYSNAELERFNELTPHILFGLSNVGLIENNFLYGLSDSLKSRYLQADRPGIIVQPSLIGVELYMWAYGYGYKSLECFFDPTLVFNPVEGIVVGKSFATR